MEDSLPRLYGEFSSWWPLMSAPEDYEAEATVYASLFKQHVTGDLRTLVEFGSGGGNNASYLKKHFSLTLVDFSPGMLAVSQALNPECEHLLGDMRSIRLGRAFDAVFINDAIMHMTTEEELHAAIKTAFAHCRPGGVALFAFDYVKETFAPTTSHGGHDGASRGMRYLEWIHDPDPEDSWAIHEMTYLMRMENGEVEIARDRLVVGVFPRATWLSLIQRVGFQGGFVPNAVDGAEVLVAVRP